MKKSTFVVAASLGLALASAAPGFAADAVSFDPDGGGGAYSPTSITVIDPAPGNSLAQGLTGLSPATAPGGCATSPASCGMTLFQANISNFLFGNSSPFIFNPLNDAAPNFTVVAGFTERIDTVTATGSTF